MKSKCRTPKSKELIIVVFQALTYILNIKSTPTQQTVSAAAFQQQQQSPEDSPIMTQGTGGGGDLYALEKVEKLKKQWLELVP